MLPIRDRLFAFPAVAVPALTAYLLGHWLTQAGRAAGESILLRQTGSHISDWSLRFLQLTAASEAHSPLQTFGNWAAIIISVTGFFIVHRLRPDRVFRTLVVHLSLSWGVQLIVLVLAIATFREILGTRG